MPPLIGAAIAAAVPAVAGVTVLGVSLPTLLGTILFTGLQFGLQQLLAGNQKKPTQTGQVQAKDPTPRRRRGYGRDKLAGSTVFLDAISGAQLFTATVHCEGPVDAYEQFWLNDKPTGIAPESLGGANPTLPWGGNVIVESWAGVPYQAASNLLTGSFGYWTAQHRLAGLAYSVVQCILPPKAEKNFQKVFPDGAPSLRVVLRLSLVHDPRVSSDWSVKAWNPNAALCILDFLVHERVDAISGNVWRFLPRSRINRASFAAFAQLCDQVVPRKDGTTEPRYTLNGTYDLAEEPRDVLRRMLATCDAELVTFPDGTVGIEGGRWEEPSVTITDEQILSFRYEQGSDKLSAFNRLKWTFTQEANDFQSVEGDPWDDQAAQNLTGEILTETVDWPMVHSHGQGRRLAKIFTAKMNPRHKLLQLVAQLPALNLVDQRVVRIRLSYLNIDAVFRIARFEPSGDLAKVTMDLFSIEPSAYAWDPASEEGTEPPVADAAAAGAVVPTPTGVALSLVTADLSGTVSARRVRAVATPVPVDDFSVYWRLIGQYRSIGGSDWKDMSGDGDAAVISDVVSTGDQIEVQVAWMGLNQQSAWVYVGVIEASA